ncbi:hypothetical protein [Chitinophaga sp. Cy-1792]|uniref:hypothetical protein n=1 Tax=Chitinophaga sp. Cy-1792 TaxID=2608339 RepID=UPI001421BB45|nr:hypothetical protein [Chitinophaga sp. Cy-1792]NIG55249.1 hypothetical protein [Chitinophaga sp. Cy-1792]
MPAINNLVTNTSQEDLIPFNSFKQLSLDKPVLLDMMPDKLMREISITPVLINRVCFPCIEEQDTRQVVNYYRLNRQYKLEHRVATMAYRMIKESGDTLVINHQFFPLDSILFENLEVVVKRGWIYQQEGRDYMILQLLNNGSGQIHWYQIVVFDITNADKIVCLNQISHVPGDSWLSGENVFTDLDNDGKLEINLQNVDVGLNVTAFMIKGDSLVKNGKQITLQQVANDSFNIVVGMSDWYFDLLKTKPDVPRNFDISEDIFDVKYEKR